MWNSIVSVPDCCLFFYFSISQYYNRGYGLWQLLSMIITNDCLKVGKSDSQIEEVEANQEGNPVLSVFLFSIINFSNFQ